MYHVSRVTFHLSSFICHLSSVICHLSHVTGNLSPVTCNLNSAYYFANSAIHLLTRFHQNTRIWLPPEGTTFNEKRQTNLVTYRLNWPSAGLGEENMDLKLFQFGSQRSKVGYVLIFHIYRSSVLITWSEIKKKQTIYCIHSLFLLHKNLNKLYVVPTI